MPFWMTLVLFLVLDYCLLGNYYSIKRIILAFVGIMYPWPPMGHAWFITYLMFLYGLYYVVSLLGMTEKNKVFILLLLSYMTMLVIINTKLFAYFALWVIYTAVFPSAVLIGMYRDLVFAHLQILHGKSRFLYSTIAVIFIAFYSMTSNHAWLSRPDNIMRVVHTFQPLTMVAFLTMLAFVVDSLQYESKILLLLGEYSYEIYLLHFPFMEYYDFVLFKKPLVAHFYVYCALIFLMSYIVRKIVIIIYQEFSSLIPRLKQSI